MSEDPDADARERDAAYRRRCHDGKAAYDSKAKAKRVAKATNAVFGGIRKVAYRCPICGYWHVGGDQRVGWRRYRNVTETPREEATA